LTFEHHKEGGVRVKISKNQLRQIIREELAQALKEDGPVGRLSQAGRDRARENQTQQIQHKLDVEAGLVPGEKPEEETGAADTGQSVASTEGKSCKTVCT